MICARDATFIILNSYDMKKILLIEDDLLISSLVEFRLNKEGYETILVKDGNEGIHVINTQNLDLIITDVKLRYGGSIHGVDLDI